MYIRFSNCIDLIVGHYTEIKTESTVRLKEQNKKSSQSSQDN